MIIYFLTTCHKLPAKKVFFDCRCKVVKEINKMLKALPMHISERDMNLSVRLVRIDDEIVPEYRKLFSMT